VIPGLVTQSVPDFAADWGRMVGTGVHGYGYDLELLLSARADVTDPIGCDRIGLVTALTWLVVTVLLRKPG
jgi:hypothetical protein